MQRVFEVAWREFRFTVMTKAFLIAAVILPVLMWGLALVLPAFLHAPPQPLEGVLAVVDPDGRVAEALALEFDPVRLQSEAERERAELRERLEQVPPVLRSPLQKQLDKLLEAPLPAVRVERAGEGADFDALKQRVRAGELLALAQFEAQVLTLDPAGNRCALYLGESATRQQTDDLRDMLRRAVVRARAAAQSLDLERAQKVLAEPQVAATTVTRAGAEAQDNELAKILVPLAFMLLLWTCTMMTGNHLLTSTIEEKSNRVIEVLLSAVSPLELLGGKILGQCGVGFLMIALYGGVGFSAAGQLGYAHLVPPGKLAFLLLYFVMGYFMVASVMAAVGSAVSELREAQTLMGPATIVFMLPFFAWFFISDNPNSTFATVLSFFPPTTAFTMILRVTTVESVPVWQILATTVVGFAGVFACVWAAARIFRVGILMSGKAATPLEMWKWMRYA